MQTVLLIFIAIFSLAIGFFLGMFLLSLDTPFSKRITDKEESSQNEGLSPETDATSEKASLAAGVKKPSPESRLILRVWKEEGKPPVYDMSGTFLEKEDLPRDILHIITVQVDSEPEIPEPVAPPAPPPTPESEQDLPSHEEEGEQEVKALSVIDEVNDILQKKLAGSPLAGKGIHLMENHNREIRFWVGLNSYSDVEDIPDPEIRGMIDAAVKEWEQNRQ